MFLLFADRRMSLAILGGILLPLGLIAAEPEAKEVAEPEKKKVAEPEAKEKRIPLPFTVSKETTLITEPLRSNGTVDYIEAFHRQESKGVTADNNAMVALLHLTGVSEVEPGYYPRLFRMMGMHPLKANGAFFMSEARYLIIVEDNDPELADQLKEQFLFAFNAPWTPKDLPDVAKWLASNSTYLDGIADACDRPRFYAPVLGDEEDDGFAAAGAPTLEPLRRMARALVIRGMRDIGMGAWKKARADAITLHRLARHVASGKHLVAHFEAIALEFFAIRLERAILEGGKLTAAEARALAADLAKLPPLPPATDKLLSTLYVYFDVLAIVSEEGPAALQVITTGVQPRKTNLAADFAFQKSIDWDLAMRYGKEQHDKLAAALAVKEFKGRAGKVDKVFEDMRAQIAKESSDDVDWLVAALDAKARAKKAGRAMAETLVRKMFESTGDAARVEERVAIAQSNVQVALALAAYRADEGDYPQELSAIAPKYLAKIPIDPWSGKEILYRPIGKGFRLWAVGPNGTDNGGEEEDDDQYALLVE